MKKHGKLTGAHRKSTGVRRTALPSKFSDGPHVNKNYYLKFYRHCRQYARPL